MKTLSYRRTLPSRRMPKFRPAPFTPLGWFVILGFVVGLAFEFWQYPVLVGSGLALLTVVAFLSVHFEKRRLREIAEKRRGESLCTFSRSFDCRHIDTWVIRAVYEAVGNLLGIAGFPLRREDNLSKTLRMDDEDLDMVVAVSIAQRTGRSLVDCESNPHFGKVQTIGDLVMFFNAQPIQSQLTPD